MVQNKEKIQITQCPNGFCIKLIIQRQDTWPTRKDIKIHFSLETAGPVRGNSNKCWVHKKIRNNLICANTTN